MSRQLHAGQLRYHDFSKLRALNQARNVVTTSFQIRSGFQQQTRSFLNSARLKPYFDLANLKSLERTANQHPENPLLQFEFVKKLGEMYPEAVVERYSQRQFALNEHLARVYLTAMQQTNNYHSFRMDEFLERLAKYNPHAAEELQSIVKETQGMSKSKQVAAIANALRGSAPASLGPAGIGGAAALHHYSGGHVPGADPKHPLYTQAIDKSNTLGRSLLRFGFQIVLLGVAVSALTALVDEKGVGRGLGMSNSKHVQEAEGTNVRFKDVKGVAEAKAELEEIVLYLRDPSKFTRLGGKLPRGLLLTGPPGTGKTLLAKAIAGEAGVPFFFSSGSQFEEVYVGLGAKRIRELFEAAKKKAPAIIFIDEIDAVGGTRKLKDQSALKMTLNELLVQLDGFDENNGIIVIGATNFMESLDPALLRPGRFDKHVTVPLPDVGGRKEILEMYAQKTKLANDVDLNVLARGTTGFSGADIANLINQAALKASIDGLNAITMSVLEYAKDKILMGAERKTAVITAETARCTAYHEAGHALVAILTDGAMPIHKATIMPRGPSLGMVTMLPEGDQTSQSYKEMMAYMDVSMGGRVAEELIFGPENITSGAASDIQQATRIARNMVTKFGFSPSVGIVYHGGNTGEESASSQTRALIDSEVKKMTDAAYERAKELLRKHAKQHRLLAETLLEYETLTGDEVRDLVKHGRKPNRPVINKDGGRRGDTSILDKDKRGSKQPLHARR